MGSAIFFFALLGLGWGFVSQAAVAEVARDRTVAINDIRQVMEEIRDTPFSQLTTIDWSAWAKTNGCNSLTNEQLTAETFDDASTPDLLKVTVKATWQTRGRPLAASLVTLRTRD